MRIFHVSLFGHRQTKNPMEIEKKLEKLVGNLINQKEYIHFYIGRNGEFDILAASIIKRIIKQYDRANASLILVLPYITAEYRDNEKAFAEYYDEIEITGEDSYFKSAILHRNRTMIDRSNLVICYISHPCGGAYQSIQYAKKCNKPIINLYE